MRVGGVEDSMPPLISLSGLLRQLLLAAPIAREAVSRLLTAADTYVEQRVSNGQGL